MVVNKIFIECYWVREIEINKKKLKNCKKNRNKNNNNK